MNSSSMTRFKTFTFSWLLSFGKCSTGILKLDRLDRLKREITSFCLAVVRSVYMIRSCSREVFMGERMSTGDATIQCYNAIWGHGPQENLLEIGLSVISCIPCIRFDCNCTYNYSQSICMSWPLSVKHAAKITFAQYWWFSWWRHQIAKSKKRGFTNSYLHQVED